MNVLVSVKRILKPLALALLASGSSLVYAGGESFEYPEQAANSFVMAVAQNNGTQLSAILGEDYHNLLPDKHVDGAYSQKFVDAWVRYNELRRVNDEIYVLAVGTKGWTLPIPIVRDGEGWRFDTAIGREQMRIRRIGRNELGAMQAMMAYHDAQIEYAQQDRNGDGVLEYAQQFISTPGQQDGLYWEGDDSPLGPLFEHHQGIKPYQGYRYRILTAQGEHAAGGAQNYISNGRLTGGFAVIAWPAKYSESGVMSFIMNRNGTIYETNLGADGELIAQSLASYDPDTRWRVVAPNFLGSQQ